MSSTYPCISSFLKISSHRVSDSLRPSLPLPSSLSLSPSQLTDLLTLYEHASQSLLLPIPDAEKLALVSQHLGEMAVLLATTRRAEEEEKRARRAAEEGGGEGGGEGSV